MNDFSCIVFKKIYISHFNLCRTSAWIGEARGVLKFTDVSGYQTICIVGPGQTAGQSASGSEERLSLQPPSTASRECQSSGSEKEDRQETDLT